MKSSPNASTPHIEQSRYDSISSKSSKSMSMQLRNATDSSGHASSVGVVDDTEPKLAYGEKEVGYCVEGLGLGFEVSLLSLSTGDGVGTDVIAENKTPSPESMTRALQTQQFSFGVSPSSPVLP
jgi:hypothetical protein